MRITTVVCALALALVLDAGAVFAQGNSGCSGTIQGGAGQGACNAYGLCKAYFSGSATGKENKRKAGPFVALVEAACSGDCDCDETPVDECVAAFCPDANPGGHGKDPSDLDGDE